MVFIDLRRQPDFPMQKLIDEGLLLDVIPLLNREDEINADRFLPGILSLAMHGEKLYAVPTEFTIRALYRYHHTDRIVTRLREKPNNWDWTEVGDFFIDDMERNKREYVFAESPQLLTTMLIDENYPYIYNDYTNTYKFDTPEFREILRTVYTLNQRGDIWDVDLFVPYNYNDVEHTGLFMSAWINGQASDYSNFNKICFIHSNNFRTLVRNYYPLPHIRGTEGIAVDLLNSFVIGANSQNKAAAWEFIKILLSDDVQSGIGIRHQPVVADISEEAVERITRKTDLTANEVLAYNLNRRNFFSGINRMYGANGAPYVMDIIIEHAENFYRNQIGIDGAIAEIQRDVDHRMDSLYFE
jgi:multiple sugar transport system substrate-binding protein